MIPPARGRALVTLVMKELSVILTLTIALPPHVRMVACVMMLLIAIAAHVMPITTEMIVNVSQLISQTVEYLLYIISNKYFFKTVIIVSEQAFIRVNTVQYI